MKNILRSISAGTLVILSTFVVNAEAALPPFYQSLAEYKALINSTEISEKFTSAEIIRDIQRDDKGFTITGSQHTLNVDVVYDRINHPGPVPFHLKFHEVETIKLK